MKNIAKKTNINNINFEGVMIIIIMMKTNKYETEGFCRHWLTTENQILFVFPVKWW